MGNYPSVNRFENADIKIKTIDFREEYYMVVSFNVLYKDQEKEFVSSVALSNFITKTEKELIDIAWCYIKRSVLTWLTYVDAKRISDIYTNTKYIPPLTI